LIFARGPRQLVLGSPSGSVSTLLLQLNHPLINITPRGRS
jgi:hypothetical protein